jgi:hypothetical protein
VTLGPVDVAVIQFDGNRFTREIVPVIREAVERGVVRIIDLVFVSKDEEGLVRGIELDSVDTDILEALSPLTDDVLGLLSEDDLRAVGDALEPNCSAAMVVFEHAWVRRLRQAIANANGRVVAEERVPAWVVERALADRRAAAAPG